MGQIRLFLRERRWIWSLGLLAAAGCAATALVFAPGFMSPDSLSQYQQATGRTPLADWHPPVLSLLWRALIAVTGTFASLAVLQAAVLWGSLWVTACCVRELTGSRPGSLAVLATGAAPHVLTFAGVVWKDVHMAYALLATCAIALTGLCLRKVRPGTPWAAGARWTLLALGVLFLSYAVLVRKNAVLAAVPVFVLLVLALWPRPSRRVWLVAVAALAAGLAVPTAAISLAARPVETSQVSQVFLDDLLHVLSAEELRAASVSPDLRERLVTSAEECRRAGALSDAYWACYRRSPQGLAPDAEQLRSLWAEEMPRHLPGYLAYRTQVFAKLLFEPTYQYHAGISANDLGLKPSNTRLAATLETYVNGAVRDLPLLFAGWFWLTVALVLAVRPGRGLFALPVRALGISSAAYILGYFPIVPVSDYRYVYWPAIAGTLALLLRWLEHAAPPAAAPGPGPARAARSEPGGAVPDPA